MRSLTESQKLANKLARQKPFTPKTATKKQRELVRDWCNAVRQMLGAK